MEAIVHFKPGSITNLVKESRMLKTALLLTAKVYTDNSGLKSLNAVYNLSDDTSAIQQYKTILNAMPALDPQVSVAHMQENLSQVVKLKNNTRKSSREIIGLKKALKHLEQVNNTFKIITETLFRASGYSTIAPLFSKKVFLGLPQPINSAKVYLHIFDEDFCNGTLPSALEDLVGKDTANENGEVWMYPLIDERDVVNCSTASILKSQPSAQTSMAELLAFIKAELPDRNWKGIEDKVKNFQTQFNGLPLKNLSKKINAASQVSICLGICSSQSFQELLKVTSPEFPSIPSSLKYVTFLFSQVIIENKDPNEQPALFRQN